MPKNTQLGLTVLNTLLIIFIIVWLIFFQRPEPQPELKYRRMKVVY